MVVAQTLGVCLGAGGVAELHVGEFLGGLDHVVLVTKGVGKDDVAAGVSQHLDERQGCQRRFCL